jgi:hypothetical protein
MGESHDSARTAELKAWMAEAEAGAARSQQVPTGEWPAPPGGLTPAEYAAVGFDFYEAGCGRYVSSSTFHVNFSPDLQHQAVIFAASEPLKIARLWVDGRALPLPVDGDGVTQPIAFAHWLDVYLSKGFMKDAQNPARAVSLRAWCSEVWYIAAQSPHSFTRDYSPPPQGVTPQECKGIGFGFHNERTAYNFLDHQERGVVHVVFSPELQHQAVLLNGSDDWSGSLLWVDGQSVPVPRDKDGDPMCDGFATWLDERFVYAQTGGLWDHPLANPAIIDTLGAIRGLLIWDTVKRVRQIVLPERTEAWTSPVIRSRENSWHIYADYESSQKDRPDRVLPIEV